MGRRGCQGQGLSESKGRRRRRLISSFARSHREATANVTMTNECRAGNVRSSRLRKLIPPRGSIFSADSISVEEGGVAPFHRPVILLGDARTPLRKRKLCSKKLCHLNPFEFLDLPVVLVGRFSSDCWRCLQMQFCNGLRGQEVDGSNPFDPTNLPFRLNGILYSG